jgi:hypothetical protein
MSHQEECIQLRKFPHHYLWNKRRSKWTTQDIKNFNDLVNNVPVKKTKSRGALGQAVWQHVNGEKKQFESVVQASRATSIPAHQIYTALSGSCRTAGGFKWEKIIINQ